MTGWWYTTRAPGGEKLLITLKEQQGLEGAAGLWLGSGRSSVELGS